MVWYIESQSLEQSREAVPAEYSAIIKEYGGHWEDNGRIEFPSYRTAELCAHSLSQRLRGGAPRTRVVPKLHSLRSQ